MKILGVLGVLFVFVLLALFSAMSFSVQRPLLYCENYTGGNGSDCDELSTIHANLTDVNVTGDLRVSGNVYVGGCVQYNTSGTPVTLGTCV